MSILFRVFKLLQTQPGHLLSMQAVFDEKHLHYRVEAFRLGLFFGGFSAGYKALVCAARHYFGGEEPAWVPALAGGAASAFVLALDPETRHSVALYMAVRALQALYNAFKSRGWWHVWGSSWPHGDTLLFSVASAQVMYAYVMRPDTLPRSYNNFIVSTGPIERGVLTAVRDQVRGVPLDVPALSNLCHRANTSWASDWTGRGGPSFAAQLLAMLRSRVQGASKAAGRKGATAAAVVGAAQPVLASALPPRIPCSVLHPQQPLCTVQAVATWVDAFTRVFPTYLTLTTVPAVVLRLRNFLRRPLGTLRTAMVSTVRSSSFLASFVAIYMASICAHRRLFPGGDSKYTYYVAGLLASLSLLIEEKSRRSELALYVLPRAMDSLFQTMRDRRWVGSLWQGETVLFSSAMAVLMFFHQREQAALGGLVRRGLGILLGST